MTDNILYCGKRQGGRRGALIEGRYAAGPTPKPYKDFLSINEEKLWLR